MQTEETAEVSIIVIDSDDEPTSHAPLVTDFFRSVKKSAKNVGFVNKKHDSMDSPVASNSKDDLSEKSPQPSTHNILQRISFFESPADEDFYQEFDSSDDSDRKAQQSIADSESDSDLDIPLSKRLAWKGDTEKNENSNDVKSDEISVIVVDEESENVKLTSVVTSEISNDCFCIDGTKNYNFTTVLEKKNNEKSIIVTEDKESVSEKEKKKRSSPKKKPKNKQPKELREANRQKSRKVEKEPREEANTEFTKIRNIDEALKECPAIIDCNLCEKYFRNGELADAFQEKGVYEVTNVPLTDNCVVWKRKVNKGVEETISENQSCQTSTNKFEDHMLLILDVDTIREMVNAYLETDSDSPTLIEWVKEVFDQFKMNLTLIFYGLETYYRRIVNNQNTKFRNGVLADERKKINRKKRESLPLLRREDVEEMIVCMQITLSHPTYRKLRVTVRNVETPTELAKMIFSYTKTIAGKPFKENRLEEHGYAWYVTGDVKGSVDISSPEDSTKLWTQQLMQFPKISSDIASSITAKYPSLFSLASEYRSINDKKTAESLLSDIKIVRRGEVTNRKVGMELSKRIYTYMTTSDPHVLLN